MMRSSTGGSRSSRGHTTIKNTSKLPGISYLYNKVMGNRKGGTESEIKSEKKKDGTEFAMTEAQRRYLKQASRNGIIYGSDNAGGGHARSGKTSTKGAEVVQVAPSGGRKSVPSSSVSSSGGSMGNAGGRYLSSSEIIKRGSANNNIGGSSSSSNKSHLTHAGKSSIAPDPTNMASRTSRNSQISSSSSSNKAGGRPTGYGYYGGSSSGTGSGSGSGGSSSNNKVYNNAYDTSSNNNSRVSYSSGGGVDAGTDRSNASTCTSSGTISSSGSKNIASTTTAGSGSRSGDSVVGGTTGSSSSTIAGNRRLFPSSLGGRSSVTTSMDTSGGGGGGGVEGKKESSTSAGTATTVSSSSSSSSAKAETSAAKGGGGGGGGKPVCCDKCDGKHATEACPHYRKKRDDHPDAQRRKPMGGFSTLPGATLRNPKCVRQPGDGSCLFHSMSYGLRGTNAARLRAEICNFISQNPKLKICDTPLQDWVKWDSGGASVGEYARRMSRGSWGGGIEMACCSHLYNCNVHVYERAGGGYGAGSTYKRISAFDAPSHPESKPIVRVLYGGGVHYDALVA